VSTAVTESDDVKHAKHAISKFQTRQSVARLFSTWTLHSSVLRFIYAGFNSNNQQLCFRFSRMNGKIILLWNSMRSILLLVPF